MSVNRVLKKRRQAAGVEQTQQSQVYEAPHQSKEETPAKGLEKVSEKQKEDIYEGYRNLSESNSGNFTFTCSSFPNTASLYKKVKIPISCFFSPVDPYLEYTERSGDNIPRCGSCRAYMNYYNQSNKKGYKCFICQRDNYFTANYDFQSNPIEIQQPSYLVDGPKTVYTDAPPVPTFIFLIDVSAEAARSRMLYYTVIVMKQILAKEQYNDYQIFFYTYDDVIHEYDFSGEEVKCTILDPSIKEGTARAIDNYLVGMREKLFEMLDLLEERAESNPKQGSNFYQSFEYVYEAVKHTAGKIFVFQANQAISGEKFAAQVFKNVQNNDQPQKIKSLLQTKNKMFFQRFVQVMLTDSISCSFFIFARGFKNIRVISDTCKLTNSQLLYYSKQNGQEQLMKFYYQFYHLLSAQYYYDVRMQMIINPAWYFTAVYGNLYRLKEFISFKFNHLESSKQVCAVFNPQEGANVNYFSMQIVTNYIINRKHYMGVSTIVIPLTNQLEKIYSTLNCQVIASTVSKISLSTMRLDDLNSTKNKFVKMVAELYQCANEYYKKKLPSEVVNLMLGFLGFLKNYHSQVDVINDTILLDKVICHRNLLQSSGVQDISPVFNPFLFNLSTMTKQMCDQNNFEYPQTCELKFNSIKQGIFLLDAGTAIYLYLGKTYNPHQCRELFGKQKLTKNDQVSEQTITDMSSRLSSQVQSLLRTLRQQKWAAWVPLIVVRCGETTLNERNFYMNFYQEKYDEFKSYRMSIQEFMQSLESVF